MLYNTGTIAINGNTATGTGTNWTAPASQVRAGQTIIVLSSPVQIFQISSVDSSTSMTVTPAAAPALSGQKYGILVSDNISVDGLAQAMSQLIKDYDENIGAWETFATTSANQNITVMINGTPVTIPGIGKLAQKGTNGALPIDQGGTGATTAEGSRTNLGLGTSATKNTGTTSNDVMQPGMFGLGRPDGALIFNTTSQDDLLVGLTGYGLTVLRNNAQIPEPWNIWNYSPTIFARTGDTYSLFSMPFQSSGKVRIFGGAAATGWTHSRILYDDKNTVVDSNGFIKQASPVVKIFTDGKYETNDESEGVTVTRLEIGQYLIEGCKALNSDAAWGGIDGGFEIPTDRNKQPLIWLDYEVNADGSVLVKTYHREHSSAPAFARNERDGLADGEPVDIPAHQFVSVRVEMPVDSIWNQKQSQQEESVKQEQGS
ncbi:phage tail protein [Enterobacter hormaechei]|uniref:phage tail fiber protein n=1 Tax=Enterobacter hormaechei TaxID=158836 RepID=UPI001A13514F|nr:phage tail protein [Enterobacter hormaechei]EKY1469256.1 phage tail protein [Enterobacter hormaechei]MDA4766280.1 phage tail protein [Enterobacter hormaechei]HAS0754012.1 phage tail protein [Enterobacter hormaechei subsp. hoffmannii]